MDGAWAAAAHVRAGGHARCAREGRGPGADRGAIVPPRDGEPGARADGRVRWRLSIARGATDNADPGPGEAHAQTHTPGVRRQRGGGHGGDVRMGRAASATVAHAVGRAARPRSPQGVASGDPGPDSVLLWTRVVVPRVTPRPIALTVEVAEDAGVRARGRDREDARAGRGRSHLPRARRRPAARARRTGIASSTRDGDGSRIGRTRTAPRRRTTRARAASRS